MRRRHSVDTLGHSGDINVHQVTVPSSDTSNDGHTKCSNGWPGFSKLLSKDALPIDDTKLSSMVSYRSISCLYLYV